MIDILGKKLESKRPYSLKPSPSYNDADFSIFVKKRKCAGNLITIIFKNNILKGRELHFDEAWISCLIHCLKKVPHYEEKDEVIT